MKAGDGIEQRGLAATRGADDDRDLAGGHVERTMVDGEDAGALHTVHLDSIDDAHAPLAGHRCAGDAWSRKTRDRQQAAAGSGLDAHRSPPSASSRVRHCIM
jgi:hypothetical protein